MSQENVALTRRAFDAFIRRDLDAFVALHHPDCVIQPLLAALDGTYYGRDGVRKWLDDLMGAFGDTSIHVFEVRELGDRTLTSLDVGYSLPTALDDPQPNVEPFAHDAHNHTDSAEDAIEQVNWILGEMRDGLIVWWRTFRSEADALEASGLRG
jgi:ketosteroid isomerase-like protein